MIYCLCEILLLFKDLDTYCLGEEFLNWTAWDLNEFVHCYKEFNCEYITHGTVSPVTSIIVPEKLKRVI